MTDTKNAPITLTIEAQDGTVLASKPVVIVTPEAAAITRESELPATMQQGAEVHAAIEQYLKDPICECDEGCEHKVSGHREATGLAAVEKHVINTLTDAEVESMTDEQLKAAVEKEREAEHKAKAEAANALFARLDALLDQRDLVQGDVVGVVHLTEDHYLAIIRKALAKRYAATAEDFVRTLSTFVPDESRYYRRPGTTVKSAVKAWLHTVYRHKGF